ncbi:hypothetical protein IDH44_01710 [Paenibacillus sp. IB182496]|uniref:FUSC family protein n=1 Tax=Paenibacillus sabuli TaxID=2772509 RepID=A0A927BQL9_9BACL|nr:aromatic acid exporter family protein [Paenibacillus sabuli]MBD2843895.1 hypothetical protein [Paenibacillus sabuli]
MRFTRHRFGKRIIKTGAAIFVTAQICDWLGLPAIFAVISAMVTIEPTIKASFRKGAIRLPSAAIGAFFAMVFDYALGPQPLTYALSALATIYVCHLLRWNDSIVVATLTAVNMITYTDVHYLHDFAIRLGTTTTGIVVSSVINLLVFPPNYRRPILETAPPIATHTLELADLTVHALLEPKSAAATAHLLDRHAAIKRQCAQALVLIGYYVDDHRIRRRPLAELRHMLRLRDAVSQCREMTVCIDVLLHSRHEIARLSEASKRLLLERWRSALGGSGGSGDVLTLDGGETSRPAHTSRGQRLELSQLELLYALAERLRCTALRAAGADDASGDRDPHGDDGSHGDDSPGAPGLI